MNLADTTLVVLNPLWGDSIQANKAGLTEAGDIFVINKADKPGVQQTRQDLMDSLSLLASEPKPAVLESIATTGEGVEALWQAVCEHQTYLQDGGELNKRREIKRQRIIRKMLIDQVVRKVDGVLDSAFAEDLLGSATLGQLDMADTLAKLIAKLGKGAKT